MSESQQRKRGAALSYVSIIINTVIQLLYTPFLIRMLGQSEYGLYSLAVSIIGYLTILDTGFGNAIIVYTSKYRANDDKTSEKKLLGMFKVVFIVLGIIIFFVGILLILNVNGIFGNTMSSVELHKLKIMLLILSINLMLTFAFTIYSTVISAYERFVFQKIMVIISTILKPLTIIPLLLFGLKSIPICIDISIINLMVLISNYIYCRKKLKINIKYNGFDKKIFKMIFGYSIWIFLGVIVDKVNWSVDNFILGAISGTIAVSIYSIAATLNSLFTNLSIAISNVLLPKVSQLVAKNADHEVLTNEFIKVGRIQNYIIFLVCSGLILFGKRFIMMWVGSAYEQSYYVALLLIIPVCVPLIQNLGISIMQAKNKYKFKAISTSIMAVVNVIISIYFTKLWGAIGAALGTCISLIICNIIITNIYYYRTIKLNVIKFWKSIIKQTIPFAIPIIIIVLLNNFLYIRGLVGFITHGFLYVILYAIVAYYISMNDYEKDIIDSILIKCHLKKVKHERNSK